MLSRYTSNYRVQRFKPVSSGYSPTFLPVSSSKDSINPEMTKYSAWLVLVCA